MTQTIREFGHYKITSEKVDECPCKYDDLISLMVMLDSLVSALFFIASAQQHGEIMFVIVFFVIGIISFIGGLYILHSTNNCGVTIKLKDNDYNNFDIKSKSFQFTNNLDCDALEIKNIISGFENYANEIDIVNKKREDEERMKSKLCCSKYKSVIERVK